MAKIRIKWRRLFFSLPQIVAAMALWPIVRLELGALLDSPDEDTATAEFYRTLDGVYRRVVKR